MAIDNLKAQINSATNKQDLLKMQTDLNSQFSAQITGITNQIADLTLLIASVVPAAFIAAFVAKTKKDIGNLTNQLSSLQKDQSDASTLLATRINQLP